MADTKRDVPLSELTFTYKEPEVLRRFVTREGYIRPRTRTGLSAQQQRQLAQSVKRARELALINYTQTV